MGCVDISRIQKSNRRIEYLMRQLKPFCDLQSARSTGESVNQAISRLQRDFVELHRRICNALCGLRIKLQPVIVRGRNRETADFTKPFEHGSGKRSSLA